MNKSKRSKGSQVWFDIKAKGGRIGRSWLQFTWWFGPITKLIGIQIGHFRINLMYDNWNKWPGNFSDTFKKV